MADIYAGLTDDPEVRKRDLGDLPSFKVVKNFSTEGEAQAWESYVLSLGYKRDSDSQGWRYGYLYRKND